MVTGTGWPGGDPFLQRQNEPSIAVSSANPQHLLAGANDYRSVDVPNSWNPGEKMAGDAWLGVFKSLDGGQTWKSYLLPGFALETPRTANSKLYVCGTDKLGKAVPCTSAADPIVRAGPDGMFYFGGIVFNRSAIPATAKGNYGKVFLTRYIDLNNKEDGNAALSASAATDPIRYVDQKEVALGGPDDFVDKPWVAIDIPRNTNTCKIVLPDAAKTTRTVAAHTVYVTYLRIVSGTQSDVMVRHSDDCGNSWSSAVKVSDGTSLANEGPSLAIDPVKGHVYVTWRRVGGLNPGQSDAIMLSRTFSHGNRFTRPRQVAVVKPFDQPTTAPTTDFPFQASFRVTLFPSSAISMDPTGVRRLHVAWSERADGTAYGNARVMVATKRLSPPPVTEYEPDEDDTTCQRLDAPRAADNRPVTADGEPLKFPMNGNLEFALGHQFMPSLTFSQGKLMLVYYDSRL
ncbi:MAG: sialidase family protein, partial [Deltaproteobacteria bacterium]